MKKRRLWKYSKMFTVLLVFTMIISCISTKVYAKKPGTGQIQIHIHNASGTAENKEFFTVTINDVQYSAVLTGSVVTVEMNTTDNVLGISKDETIEIPFTSSKGSGVMVVSHQEGNGNKEQDEGLNNFKTVSIVFSDLEPTPDPTPVSTPVSNPTPASELTPEPEQSSSTAIEYVPKTGEMSTIPFAYGIMAMSATGVVRILFKRKSKITTTQN